MQKIFRYNLLVALAAIVLFASCSKTNKEGKYVPENAMVAVIVNGESLNAKLPWDEVKQNSLFTDLNADSTVPSFAKKIFDNPENSGIDIKKDLIFYVVKDSSGGYGVFTGTLKDSEKFRQFALEATEGGSESEKDGIKTISKAPFIAGYNKDQFLCLVDMKDIRKSNSYNTEYNDSKPRDLAAACVAAFNLSEKKSLGSNEKFTTLVKEKGDVHFWFNTAEMYKDMPTGMFKMDKLYEGNITAATLNFENGKILIAAKNYTNKEMAAIWKKYNGSGIDENMIKSIPSSNVAALFALNFKPEGINEMLKVAGIDGMVTLATAFLGISVDDFIRANKGDIMIAVTDFKPGKDTVIKTIDGKTSTTISSEPQPDFLFATSIGDKDAFNSLIKTAKRLGEKEMSGEDADKVSYNMNGKYFAIGNNKANVDKFIAGGNNNFEFLKKLSGNAFGGYINAQYLLQSMEAQAATDSTHKIIHAMSLKMFQDVYFTGGNFVDGALTSDAEINLVDKNTNSLKQLNSYLGEVAKLMKEKHEKQQSLWDVTPKKDGVKIEAVKIEDLKLPKNSDLPKRK